MSFERFQGVNQTSPNSCGAFALAAALEDMGLAEIPMALNTEVIVEGYTKPSPQAYAQRIYQITGNVMLGESVAMYQYSSPAMHQNPPSALTCVAHRSGMEASCIRVSYNIAAQEYFSRLELQNISPWPNLFDAEVALISPQFGEVMGPVEYLSFPEKNQVHLLGVNDHKHWIVIGYDTCYDSASGTVCRYDREQPLPLRTFITLERKYKFSGWWISLERQ
ncbi:hypothetical protein [Chitinophaga tropicalis]|uniref:Peptidase C39-like domain-containing protein n=1 Tax=Chitinophaga tropicalis TaxID=2683588 RepID=A0A7K1U3R6_9BACT|nr:hypothetical protein [Chitinophaga tropicalis]MVT09003.1 hypothetical protein [Chitinophaga tropicalis]